MNILYDCEYLLIVNCEFFPMLAIDRFTNAYTIIRYRVDLHNIRFVIWPDLSKAIKINMVRTGILQNHVIIPDATPCVFQVSTYTCI